MRNLLLAMVAALVAGLAWFLFTQETDMVAPRLDAGPLEEGPSAPIVSGGPDAIEPQAETGRQCVGSDAPVFAEDQALPESGPDEHPWQGQFAGVTGRILEADLEPAVGLEVTLLEFGVDSVLQEKHAARALDSLSVGIETTGADGRFQIDGAMGVGVHGIGIDMGGARSTVRFVEDSLVYGGVTDVGDIVLSATGTVIGVVLDEDGEGVEGARVRFGVMPEIVGQAGALNVRSDAALALPEGSSPAVVPIPAWARGLIDELPISTGYTDSEGEFRIEGVPVGRVTGGADHPGMTAALAGPFELAAGEEYDAGELELLIGRTAEGRVLDAAGQPVEGAFVMGGTMQPLLQAGFLHPAAPSGPDGSFSVEGLAELGDVVVAARRDPRDPWTSVLTNRSPRGLVITLEAVRDATVKLVDDATGDPVAGAEFELRAKDDGGGFSFASMLYGFDRGVVEPSHVRFAEPGTYVVESLPVGEWQVVVRVPGYAPLEATLTHAEPLRDHEFRMERGVKIPVLVTNDATGEPVAGAHVALMLPDFRLPTAITSGWTDATGHVELGPVASEAPQTGARDFVLGSGGRDLVAQHPAFGRQTLAYVAPPKGAGSGQGEPQAPFEISLIPVVKLEGRVTWGGGAPGVRYMATLTEQNFNSSDLPRFALTGDDGGFSFRGLNTGQYRMDFTERFLNRDPLGFFAGDSAGRAIIGPTIVIDGAEPDFVRFDLSPEGESIPGRIIGQVTIDGQPFVGARVALDGDDEQPIYTDSSGRFEVGDLEATSYTIEVMIQDGEMDESSGELRWVELDTKTAVVHSGSETRIGFHFLECEAELLVLDGGTGEPLEGADITYLGDEVATSGPSGLARVSLRLEPELKATPGVWISRTVHSLRVTLEGYDRRSTVITEAIAQQSLEEPIEVRLVRTVPCEGRVVLPAGVAQESERFWVLLEGQGGDGSIGRDYLEVNAETLTFKRTGIDPGRYDASLFQDGPGGKRVPMELPEGGSTNLVLDFSR